MQIMVIDKIYFGLYPSTAGGSFMDNQQLE